MRKIFDILIVAILLSSVVSCDTDKPKVDLPEIAFRSNIEQSRGGLVESEADIRDRGISLSRSL